MKHIFRVEVISCLLALHGVTAAARAQGVLSILMETPLEVLIAGAVGVLLLVGALLSRLLKQRTHKAVRAEDGKAAQLHIDLHSLPVPVAALDNHGRLIETNRAWRRLFGFAEGTQDIFRLTALIHPADMDAEKQRFEALLNRSVPQYESELRFYTLDDRLLHGRLSVEASGTAPAAAIARVEDLTRAHAAETSAQAARAALHDLYSVVVESGQKLDERLRAVLEMGCRHFGVETGIVGRVRDDLFEIVQVVSPGERIWRGQSFPLETGESALGQTSPARVPIVAQAIAQIKMRGAANHHCATERETYLGVPICVAGRPHGILCFASLEPRSKPFETSDTEMLHLIADWLGGEIERAQTRRQLEQKSRQLEQQQQELIEANERLEQLATRDGLTGAYNRRFLDMRLDEEIARARRYQTPLSFLMLDVDKFKQYNDNFGHPAGDVVLKKMAQLLTASVRSIDVVARYGGEEFAVILPNTDVAGAMILAERLRIAVESENWPERAITASFGVASVNEKARDRATLINAADGALYRSKEAGRNRVTHAEVAATCPPAPSLRGQESADKSTLH